MAKTILTQGDALDFQILLRDKDGIVSPENAEKIEFMLGSLRKVYPEEVSFDAATGKFLIPLTQEETFTFGKCIKCQARVKYEDGSVRGTEDPVYLDIGQSISKAVL